MTPVDAIPPQQDAAQHAAVAPSITVAFAQDDFERLRNLAPGGDVGKFLVQALVLYQGIVELNKEGFSRLQLVNPKTGEGRVFSGPIFPEG